LALVIFGPAKLPHLVRELGKYRAQFKQMQRTVMEHVETEISNMKPSGPDKTTIADAPVSKKGHIAKNNLI
jgi:Sec-independent protein translocase protein TatA